MNVWGLTSRLKGVTKHNNDDRELNHYQKKNNNSDVCLGI